MLPLTSFTVTTGSPLSAGGRLSVPFPVERLAGGWRFEPPFIAAGVSPGRELEYLNAPLSEERAYLFGGLLGGVAIGLPDNPVPIVFGPEATLVSSWVTAP